MSCCSPPSSYLKSQRTVIKSLQQELDSIEQRIASLNQASDPIPQNGTDAPKATQPAISAQGCFDIMRDVEKFQEKLTWTLQESSVIEVVFAKLELYKSWIRATWMDKTDFQRFYEEDVIDAHQEMASNYAAYSNAVARSCCTGDNVEIDRSAVLKTLRQYGDSELQELAAKSVALDLADEKLNLFRQTLPDTDVDGLNLLWNCGSTLLIERRAHLDRLRSFLRNVASKFLLDLAENKLSFEERKTERQSQSAQLRGLLRRLSMAVFGGLTLIVPMLIMVLHPGLTTVLLTTSTFVFVVGILLAMVMTKAEEKDVVGATAAYAAVLVVFVGTGGDYTSDQGGQQVVNGTFSEQAPARSSASLSNGQLAGVVVGCLVGSIVVMSTVFVVWVMLAYNFPEKIRAPLPGSDALRKIRIDEKLKAKQNASTAA